MPDIKNIREIVNFRDLGGYKAAGGRVIKPGLLYRSGGLYQMNAEEMEIFNSLGIKAVLDLRTAAEEKRKPDPVMPGVRVVRHSGVEFRGGGDIDFSPQGMRRMGSGGRDQFDKIHAYYLEMPFDNEAFRILVREVESGDLPIVFHCASGKDRTGMAAIVLMALLGVSREDILKDYELSNVYMAKVLKSKFEQYHDYASSDPVHTKLLQMEFGVLPEMGREVVDAILARYGSFEGYAEAEYGLDGRRLSDLRDRCLEDI